MKQIVELYINNQKVYFTQPPDIFFNYTHSDLHNPTVVKNSFSKTLTIDGVPENNRIFNEFYDLRRINGENLFNASRKETFVLYRNGEVMDTGYVKLDKVNRKGKQISYDITLYGGLGQFLYNLKFNDDGEQMKLSDLEYATDFNFEVNKDTVRNAWQHITEMKEVENAELYDIINFAPCYNGIPDDFSADKVAIDVESFENADDFDLSNQFVTSKDGYSTVNGWLVGELAKEYDEWQMMDLRSYLQRPVIRYKEIINACCNPDNNGGWQVDLDPDFFNEDNPYYEDAWMTLPLVTEMEVVENISSITTSVGETITVSGLNENQDFNITVKAKVGCRADSTAGTLQTCYYGSSWDGSDESAVVDESTNFTRYIQLVAYDRDGNILNGSPVNSYYSYGGWNSFEYDPEVNTVINRITGNYIKDSEGVYSFNNKFYDFTIKNLKYQDGMYFEFVEKFAYDSSPSVSYPSNTVLYTTEYTPVNVTSYTNAVDENVVIVENKGLSRFVNKKTLLNSEKTPCDYFLSYLKLFNLHIWKDTFDNIIYVRLRKNYFTGEIRDIEDVVDRDNDISITPITFENKWLNFNNEMCETSLAKEYKEEYGIEYGIQKIDTNYNFDTSSKNLFEGNVFKGTVQIRNKSKYYMNLHTYNTEDIEYPPFMLDGCNTLLFNASGDTTEGSYITPKTTERAVDWWKEKSYDILPKPLFADKDNKSVDGANVLLFYNGRVLMKAENGDDVLFSITDDIPEFEILNDGEPCWIWTYDTSVATDTRVGGAPHYGNGYLPCFSRYITNENGWITHSWDFGTPKVLYLPEVSIDNSSNIYTQYWQSYIRDQYDANTKKVECYVKLNNPVFNDILEYFYYWDGRYWMLNGVIDYNPSSFDTTKCEFVSINNISNYLQ